MGRGPELIPRTIWLARLTEASGAERVVCVPNTILSSGRRDALAMLVGMRSPGTYKWMELGSSAAVVNATQQTGCVMPFRLANDAPFRVAASVSTAGSDFALNAVVPGTTLVGPVREAAIFPSSQAGGGPALYRIVFPTTLALTVSNTLTISVFLTP